MQISMKCMPFVTNINKLKKGRIFLLRATNLANAKSEKKVVMEKLRDGHGEKAKSSVTVL